MAAAPRSSIFFILLLQLLQTAHSFVFNSFKSAQSNLTLSGAALITNTSILQLTDSTGQNLRSNVFYYKPLPFHLHHQPTSSQNLTSAVSFSTTFIFSILTDVRGGAGGFGFTFAISPTRSIPIIPSVNSNYFGLFTPENDGMESNHIFAVEFDTVLYQGQANSTVVPDINDNHVGIDINGMNTISPKSASYYNDATKAQTDVQMESDNAFQVWIDYDGPLKTVNVTISPLYVPKPSKPLIFYKVDLSPILKPFMYVGFTSATNKLASAHYILAWSFSLHKSAIPLDLTKIPKRPTWSEPPQFRNTGLRVGAVSSAATLFVIICGVIACFLLIRRMKLRDVVEEWELDFPHRFKYAHLYAATDGFSDGLVVGQGGFGCVYKGIMRKTKQVIAVKKMAHNSKQGLKEFVAEVATLGKLRHRNLVHLEGWCKRSSYLLLVYEFMSNGSLDSFLFDSSRNLGWAERFRIIKEVAAGLVYLHHEWEQVVVHRDVKANNVLLDFNMTAKLGDFGLAKLYEHGENPATTHVVGTVGYIAPELVHIGRSTTKSDVYSFGALVCEVVSGRRPLDPLNARSEVLLQDWIRECYKMGRVWEVVDPKLRNEYVKSEVELVLKVGLICSQYEAEARPSMLQVVRYLGGFDALPSDVVGVVKNVGWKDVGSGKYSDPRSSGGVLTSTTSFGTSSRYKHSCLTVNR